MAAVLVAAAVAGWLVAGHADPRARAAVHHTADPPPPAPAFAIDVASGPGRTAIASGFLGLSMEFQAVRAYTGSDPAQIDPVLVQLIRNLTPGQAPVLRIGGDSTDDSYAPSPSVAAPPYVAYRLTPGWMATTAALAHALGARMILGLNLAADDPALDAVEVRDYVSAFGRASIEALEIGNEPNIYDKITLLHTALGAPYRTRAPTFDFAQYAPQFAAVAGIAEGLPLAGPALAVGPAPDPGSWASFMPGLMKSESRLRILTIHRYPLRNCYVPPSSVQYPTIAHLLSSYATAKLAGDLRPWVALAHAAHRQLRVDELNSVACRGRHGVSDTFASSLWITDALFSLAGAGVDGVNLHTLPDAPYELFRFSRADGRWEGHVQPIYYGLQLFAQAAPAGSRLLRVSRNEPSPSLSVWATHGADGHVRVVLIDKSLTEPVTAALRLPAASDGSASIERMLAPSITARGGVTLGGRSYGRETFTGQLAPAVTQPLTRLSDGAYLVTLPAASAALVTGSPPVSR